MRGIRPWYAHLPHDPRFALSSLWRATRKRVFWWCGRRGCWARSVVTKNGRGNVCPRHLLEAIFSED